jgi:hypothetical protein
MKRSGPAESTTGPVRIPDNRSGRYDAPSDPTMM